MGAIEKVVLPEDRSFLRLGVCCFLGQLSSDSSHERASR